MFSSDWGRRQLLHDLKAVAAACDDVPDIGLGPDFSLPDGDVAYEVLERLQLVSFQHDVPDVATFALALLLAEAMGGASAFVMTKQDWQDHADFVCSLAPPRRAVLMRAWRELDETCFEDLTLTQAATQMQTLDRALVVEPLITLAKAMSEAEINSVAMADYGLDVHKHEAALRAVLAEPECRFSKRDRWFPAEVVELTAHVPKNLGAVGCTALCILDDIHNNGDFDQMTFRWGRHSADYLNWPASIREPILRGVRYLYEFERDGPWGFQFPKTAQPIPWFDG